MSEKDAGIRIGNGGGPLAASSRSSSVPIGMRQVRFGARAKADIVFAIDTTGSMENEIHGLLKTSQAFVDRLAARSVDWQIAIVAFGDLSVPGDKIQATPFSSDARALKRWLCEIPRNDGGDNLGESSLPAVVKALSLSGWRSDATKIIILMTDEPALRDSRLTPRGVTEMLQSRSVLAFVISEAVYVRGQTRLDLSYFKRMAETTGGRWFQISAQADFLSVLDALSREVSSVVCEVRSLAGGDVATYLRLKSGN